MNVTSTTKRILIIGAALATSAIGVAAYLLVQIDSQGKRLDENIQIISDAQVRKETKDRISRIFEESIEDRQVLSKSMLRNPTDSVVEFVTFLEDFAPQVGIEFTVETLGAEIPVKDAPGSSQMRLGFSYEGDKQAVINFSNLLENVPYISYLESLTMSAGENNTFEARTVMVIMISSL